MCDVIYSVFEMDVYQIVEITEEKTICDFVKELFFYHGDLSNVDILTDERFKEVKGKRKNCVFLGIKRNIEFPINYPLILDNNTIINDIYVKPIFQTI